MQSARLIPAHAGKTAQDPYGRETLAAHPRSRGENDTRLIAGMGPQGSSPLTRGKPHTWPAQPVRTRLIPAHAGKTHGSVTSRASTPAHPRSRGENQAGLEIAAVVERLIPAHAGKTSARSPRLMPRAAHPRSRGENLPKDATVREMRGSSPLTRGKHRVNGRVVGAFRLIPAHAGKTQ